jgi:malate synthase
MFSAIKTFPRSRDMVLPDRAAVGMTVPFMRAYTGLLVKTCHRRGAHAIGGMAAFIPSRRDAELNRRALAAVRADKARESHEGFDGTWIAHPDLEPVAREAFHEVLGSADHQKHVLREDVEVGADDLLAIGETPGDITRAGVELNVSVSLQYLTWWLRGVGAVAINDLMEDTATAEISRAQLWQWLHHRVELDDGERLTVALYRDIRERAKERLEPALDDGDGRLSAAAEMLDELVLGERCPAFLTLEAIARL